ncbi:MAG: M20 family metallopeptidase [Pirellulales bacterium]
MPLDPVELLQQLIAIPSVNPLGQDEAAGICGESRLTDFLQGVCERLGWRWLRQRVHPGRENLFALVPGSRPAGDGGELQLWDVHQDTVAVHGMTVDPFGGELRDGRVYGRGACDDKGPMAAMIAALSRVENLSSNRPTIVLAFPVNEECGFTGATALCDLWHPERRGTHETTGTITAAELFPRAPDLAIVAEPTELNVLVAHQGMVRWRCHVTGRAAHSSRPDEGVNAIYAMGRIAATIEKFQRQLAAGAEHPLCGRPAVCVTTIAGGVGINTVPDRATITIDRRIGPGESPLDAYAQLVTYVAEHTELGDAQLQHDPPFMKSHGLSDAHNRAVAERLVQLVSNNGRPSKTCGAPYGTDGAAIGAVGVPTVVFGPGSIRHAHMADEFIEVAELQLGADLFERIARGGLSGS